MSKIKPFLIGVSLTSFLMAVGFASVQEGLVSLPVISKAQVQSPIINTAISKDGAIPLKEATSASNSKSTRHSANLEPANFESINSEHSTRKPLDNMESKKTANIKQIYIKDHEVKARSKPSIGASIVAEYRQGTRLQVIDEIGDWYVIKDNLNRHTRDTKYADNRKGLGDNQGTIIVYVQKSETSETDVLALDAEKLHAITYFGTGDDYNKYDAGKALPDGYLTIEPISKTLYERQRQSAVNFLDKTSPYVKDKAGVLTISLPESPKKIVFKDHVVDNDGTKEFSYVGNIKALNQHLVLGNYWESYDYTFYDMTTGEKTQSFIDYPLISPDQQFIMSIYANPYEMDTEIDLYKVNGPKIQKVMSVAFDHWLATFDSDNIFWAKDGYIYAPVNHVVEVWRDDGNYNETFQYIRIKVDL